MLTSTLDEMMQCITRYEKTVERRRCRFPRPALFLPLHRRLLEAYPQLESNDQPAIDLDRRLDHYLRTSEVGSSRLRRIVLQLHATLFSHGSGREHAHDYATECRPPEAKADGPFFLHCLGQELLDHVSAPMAPAVRLELFVTIARYENAFDRPPVFTDTTELDRVARLPRNIFVIGLIRRWEAADRQNLSQRAGAIESRLLGSGAFAQRAASDPVLTELLGAIGYLRRPGFLERLGRLVARIVSSLGAWLRGLRLTAPTALYTAGSILLLACLLLVLTVCHQNAELYENIGSSSMGAPHAVRPAAGLELSQ